MAGAEDANKADGDGHEDSPWPPRDVSKKLKEEEKPELARRVMPVVAPGLRLIVQELDAATAIEYITTYRPCYICIGWPFFLPNADSVADEVFKKVLPEVVTTDAAAPRAAKGGAPPSADESV